MPAELATSLAATEAQRLEQAEALVRGFCGWHIAPSRSVTATLRVVSGSVLLLPSMYVTAITSVTEDGTLLTDEDDYTWSAAGVLTRLGYWPAGKLVDVAYTHGYATSPPEVAAIVVAVAQRLTDNPGSKPRTGDGPFSDTFSQTAFNQAPALALLESEKEALRRYRIPGVA